MENELHRNVCRVVGHDIPQDSHICERCEQLAADILIQRTLEKYIGRKNGVTTRGDIKQHLVSEFTSLICEGKVNNFTIDVSLNPSEQIEVTVHLSLPGHFNTLTLKGILG